MAWPVNARTSLMMDEAQSLYGATITATQGSPNPGGVGASAGTHDGEGVIDVVGADLDAIVIAMRQVGFAAWHRTTAQGFSPHVHGVAIGEPLLSPQAAAQVDSYLSGHNGLRGNGLDDGPRDWVGITWETYTGGTYVPPTGGDPVFQWDQYPGDRCGSYLEAPDGILAGSPTVVANPGFTQFNRTRIASPLPTMTLSAGDSVMLTALHDFEYGRPVDPTAASWLIRSTGGGTLEVADAFDEGYNYPAVTPTWVPQSRIGDDADGITHFTLDPDMIDLAHLWDDGAVLIRITCTAGTALIDFVGVQVESSTGFWLPEGTFVWSDTFPASTREPIVDFLNTYAFYTDGGGVTRWTVDDTEMLLPAIDGGGHTWVEWRGNATSFVDAADANSAANADFQPYGDFATPVARVTNTHVPLAGDIFGGITPEHWDASIREGVSYSTAPTKATLVDVTPDEIDDLEAWQYDSFEWTDDDTGFLGWIQYGARAGYEYEHYVETAGDTDTVTYSLITSATGGEDLHAAWFAPGAGSEVTAGSMPDVPPGADAAQLAIPETFLTTSDRLLYARLELARRFTDQTDQYTVEFGYSSGNEGTIATLAVVRISDGAHVAATQVAARFRVPPWRYRAPLFRSGGAPVPDIDFDEDLPLVTWLRQRQRNDGLGNSVIRARGSSSRQMSLRQRGYR